MTKEEAKITLANLKRYMSGGGVVDKSVNKAIDMAIEALSQPEPHWIPVTERLPKSKEEDLEYPTVLICFENEEIMLGCFYESTKEWGTGEHFDKKCNPIAWMPLPEPMRMEKQ